VTCHGQPDRANHREENAESRDESALETARRADADQVPHEEPEIEAAGMNQQPLADVACPRRRTRRIPPVSKR
jgi:hypothetical protein